MKVKRRYIWGMVLGMAAVGIVMSMQPVDGPPIFGGDPIVDPEEYELTRTEDGYLQVSFPYLSSFKYVMPKQADINRRNFTDQVPQYIKDLHGQRIVVAGFLLPGELEGEKLKSILLVNSLLGCCFGGIPGMNEWIHVTLGEPVDFEFALGTPMEVYGVLDVGEFVDDHGGLLLYRMTDARLVSPKDRKKWWQRWGKAHRQKHQRNSGAAAGRPQDR